MPEGTTPEPLIDLLVYPLTEETASKEIDPATGEPEPLDIQNEKLLKLRTEFLKIVDWEAIAVTGVKMVFRLKFALPGLISVTEDAKDVLFLTMKMQEFPDAEGAVIPNNLMLSRNLPSQLRLDSAIKYETAGKWISGIFLALMAINGGMNSVFEELDFSVLFDAIEGP